jgi:hypothetical protein
VAKTIECYGVVDGGELMYETIADTPMDALRSAEWGEDGNDTHARMILGLIKVHHVCIHILDEATIDLPKSEESK